MDLALLYKENTQWLILLSDLYDFIYLFYYQKLFSIIQIIIQIIFYCFYYFLLFLLIGKIIYCQTNVVYCVISWQQIFCYIYVFQKDY